MKDKKLLAEYLGIETINHSGDYLNIVRNDMVMEVWDPEVHWDQLMQVVAKIREESSLKDIPILKSAGNNWEQIDMCTCNPTSRKTSVYNACVEYIKSK